MFSTNDPGLQKISEDIRAAWECWVLVKRKATQA